MTMIRSAPSALSVHLIWSLTFASLIVCASGHGYPKLGGNVAKSCEPQVVEGPDGGISMEYYCPRKSDPSTLIKECVPYYKRIKGSELESFLNGDISVEDDGTDRACEPIQECYFHGPNCAITNRLLSRACSEYEENECKTTPDDEYCAGDNGTCDLACNNNGVGCTSNVCDNPSENCGCHEEGACDVDLCLEYGLFCAYDCEGKGLECDLQCDPSKYIGFLNSGTRSEVRSKSHFVISDQCFQLGECALDPTIEGCDDVDMNLCETCEEYCDCECDGLACEEVDDKSGNDNGSGKDAGMGGDPHIKTWAGDWFNFQGMCDLVLLFLANFNGLGDDLAIHTRLTTRYDYSYIESVAIQIGTEDVFEVESFGQYSLSGIDNADLTSPDATLGGYLIYHSQPSDKEHVFDIVLGKDEYISISTFKDLVSIKFHVPRNKNGLNSNNHNGAISFANSTGIMGRFSDGKLLARGGKTEITDHNKFGEEWQVLDSEPMLFRTARAPQYPQQCLYPTSDAVAKQQRRLGETRAKAEKACAHLKGQAKEACVEDVMVVGDVDMAKAGGY